MLRGARKPVENTGAVVENQGGASALWKTRVLANRSMFNKTTRPTCPYPNPEIREAMRAYQAQKGADGIVLCITDIMEEGSQVLLEGDTAAAQKGLKIEDVADGVWCPGVLSRKKQVAAPILAAN